MNSIFRNYIGKFELVYLDDILIFSKNPQEHAQHLRIVLDILRQHKSCAKMPKCEFNKPELQFLGHIVGRQGIRMDPSKTAVIAEWPLPKNAHELTSFLGLANYFRKHVQGFSKLVGPLTDLLRSNTPWVWSHLCQEAFQATKAALTSSPVLVMPDFGKPFEVISDALVTGIGAVLLQQGRPVACESKKLSSAEHYCTTGVACGRACHEDIAF